MKQTIKKEYIKTNLIGFIIAGIIVSGVVVYAAVTFPSNEVSYSNSSSGLNSTNVQGAIDELYEECTKVPAPGDTILDNVDVVTSGDGLYEDEYEDGRYFYKGKNVNNYITFNNEVWRIVSIEPDKTIKIMRDAVLSDRAWDDSNSNNWSRPATLNTYLNGSYLTETLSTTAQGQIVAKDWSIGGIVHNEKNMNTHINKEKSKIWNGKVALITASEYIRSNSNQSNCGTFELNETNYNSCKNTTWMQNSKTSYWWTLTPYASVTMSVFSINSNGNINLDNGHFTARAENSVRPAVYLSSSVQITGGNGSSSSPYTLA